MIVIGNKQNKLYLKQFNLDEGTLEFTNNADEALRYHDGWKPGVELDNLRFNFGEEYPQLFEMSVVDTYEDDAVHEEITAPAGGF